MTPLPKCPRCRTNSSTVPLGEIYACRKCGGLFDDDPDEGGDFSDRDPSARLNFNEQNRKRPSPKLRRR